MSDAEMNYEHTKSHVKVPHGWRIVADTNAMDVTRNEYHWWNPTEGPMGAWLKLDTTNAADMQAMGSLWNAGATCFIEADPDPAPVPPPPPAFLSAPPAIPAAIHAPSEAIHAAPPAPVFTPPAPPAPPALPVAVAVTPIIPVIPPAPPAPPAFHAPSAPVVIPPVQVIPAVPAVPVMPSIIPQAPARVVATDIQESNADENEVDAWLAALDGVKDRIKALEAVKAEVQKKIVAKCFPDGLREGSNSCKLPDGRKLTITGVVNRTFDDALVPAACDKIIAAGGNPEGVFVTKLAIGTAAYKALDTKFRNLLADCVTEKDGTPQFKVTEPRK